MNGIFKLSQMAEIFSAMLRVNVSSSTTQGPAIRKKLLLPVFFIFGTEEIIREIFFQRYKAKGERKISDKIWFSVSVECVQQHGHKNNKRTNIKTGIKQLIFFYNNNGKNNSINRFKVKCEILCERSDVFKRAQREYPWNDSTEKRKQE